MDRKHTKVQIKEILGPCADDLSDAVADRDSQTYSTPGSPALLAPRLQSYYYDNNYEYRYSSYDNTLSFYDNEYSYHDSNHFLHKPRSHDFQNDLIRYSYEEFDLELDRLASEASELIKVEDPAKRFRAPEKLTDPKKSTDSVKLADSEKLTQDAKLLAEIMMQPNVEFEIELEKPAPKKLKVPADQQSATEKPPVVEKTFVDEIRAVVEKPIIYLLAKDLWWKIEKDLSVENMKNLSEYINIQRREDGMTALHLAVLKGDWNLISTLIEHGANIHIKNRDGLSPFELAKSGWKGSFNLSSGKAKSSENGITDSDELWISYKHYCNVQRKKEALMQAREIESSASRVFGQIFIPSEIMNSNREFFKKYKDKNTLIKNGLKKVD